jgi:DNA invertase Pin-like site-specific DNA recombinase
LAQSRGEILASSGRIARRVSDMGVIDGIYLRGGGEIFEDFPPADAGFRSLRDGSADTTTPHGRLMLTVLAGLAEFERELIRTRTGEGRERAKARGVHLGRKPKLTPHQRTEALARRATGEPLVEIGRSYAVSHSTISRLR